jgi:hypothetical protein
VLAAGMTLAAAQELKAPRITHPTVDWTAALADLHASDAFRPAPEDGDGAPVAAHSDPLGTLNDALAERFPRIAASVVPVLLPFDTAAFLRDRADGKASTEPGSYLAGFEGVPFFLAGPGGYDAVITARAQDLKDLGITFADRVLIHVSGAGVLYELDEPAARIAWPVPPGLDTDFPGIKRMFLENYVRYAFERYGVTYVVAIECHDGGARFRRMACRDADKVALRVLKGLQIVGGQPAAMPTAPAASTIERPAAESTVFTYYPPGDLGRAGKIKGDVDYTAYARIRFPMADAPAFANTQFARSEPSPQNYSYPWRDNFCEARAFFVGQCARGLGHQGQDLRPAYCRQRTPGGRCEPYEHDVVAVRDGAVMRAPGQQAVYVVFNAPNERVRVRYLHMSPKKLDADGMVSGRSVKEGEVIGQVGNFWYRENATTYHLHFDLQVPTKYGWVFVNPYMTLVTAYERLIRGRGVELREDGLPVAAAPPVQAPPSTLPVAHPPVAAAPAVKTPIADAPPAQEPAANPEPATATAAKPTETAVESPSSNQNNDGMPRDDHADETPADPAGVATGHGGLDGDAVEPAGDGAKQADAVRPVGRRFPHAGTRSWHLRRNLQPGDGQPDTRHGGL